MDCYGEPLLAAVEAGAVDAAAVDRALERVLRQKCELGLLDADWAPGAARGGRPRRRCVARRWPASWREQSIVLLHNDGTLPLAPGARGRRGRAARRRARRDARLLLVPAARRRPPPGRARSASRCRPWSEALRPSYDVTYALGCPVIGGDDDGIAEAVAACADAAVCVVVLGDRAGTVRRRDVRRGLRRAGPAAARPSGGAAGSPAGHRQAGRAWCCCRAGRTSFPGRSTGWPPSSAGSSPARRARRRSPVCSADGSNPSGRLPVSFPAAGASQPSTYLAAPLGRRSEVSTIDPTPLFPFGHGLSYAPVTWVDVVRHGLAVADRRRVPGAGDPAQRPRAGPRPKSSRCTCTTRSRRSRGPSGSSSRPAGSRSSRGRRCVVDIGLHADLTSLHRPGRAAPGRARRRRAAGRDVERADRGDPALHAHRAAAARRLRAGAGSGVRVVKRSRRRSAASRS